MIFKKGEKVYVKSLEQIKAVSVLDTEGDWVCDDCCFIVDPEIGMAQFCGQEFTILLHGTDVDYEYYVLMDEHGEKVNWCWVAPWLERAPEPYALDDDLFLMDSL